MKLSHVGFGGVGASNPALRIRSTSELRVLVSPMIARCSFGELPMMAESWSRRVLTSPLPEHRWTLATVNPRFYSQRILYFSFSITFFLLIAFSWNDKVANWDQNSLFYVPHISKISVFFIILIYLIYRMIILPNRKNVKLTNFNLVKFAKFFFISIILDFIKLFAFINRKNKY